MTRKGLSIAIYGLSTAIGLLTFIYPFLAPAMAQVAGGQAHANDAPLVLSVLVSVCFVVLLLEIQTQAVNTKLIALLGILVSMNAMLRFLEIAVPGPGGISPIFFLIVMTGYVYGARLGFLMGALTLLVSGLITGSLGPWLPYQMFTASWIGMSAALCRPLVRVLRGEGRRREIVVLAFFSAVWGLVFGAVMNIWFWPFATGPADQYWEAGISVLETIRRYAAFYLTTSFVWDVFRAAGNVLLTVAFAAPTLRALRRFRRRFEYDYQPSAVAERSRAPQDPRRQLPARQNVALR
jgi:energy-coupling factor transport system substrate-specific component